MGLCAATQSDLSEQDKHQQQADKIVNRTIERGLQKDAQLDKCIKKLLLLGAGESGKSTLFKQMITIYGKGFPEEERKAYVQTVWTNTYLCMRALCEQGPKYGEVGCTDSLQFILDLEKQDDIEDNVRIDMECVQHYKALWADKAIQAAFVHQNKFHLPDSAKYYMERLDAMAAPDYVASDQDILRTRTKTSGIIVHDFNVNGDEFKLIDVGGQRNERKKWIACFEGVTAVVFVGVLSEYDLTLLEDETHNRMIETLTLFEEICNSPFFQRTALILMLNKRDSFAEKIEQVPLNACPLFANYAGPNTYDAGLATIQGAFLARAKNKLIYTHVTCATDTNNMKVVLAAVKDIVVRAALNEVGLLG